MSGFYLDAESEEASEASPTQTAQAASIHGPPLCFGVCEQADTEKLLI